MKWTPPDLGTTLLTIGFVSLAWWFLQQLLGAPVDGSLLGFAGAMIVGGASEKRNSRRGGGDPGSRRRGLEDNEQEDQDPPEPPSHTRKGPKVRQCHTTAKHGWYGLAYG